MTNILFVTSYPYKKCGISSYSKNILENISNSEITINIQTLYFAKKPLIYPIDSLILIYKLIFSRFKIIHFQFTPTIVGPLAPIFYILVKLRGKYIVTTVHENPDIYLNYLPNILKNLFTKYYNFILEKSDKIIALNRGQKATIKNLLLVPSNKITVIPIGIDTKNYITSDQTIEKFKKLKKFKIIGFFGFLRAGKGIEILINSFCELKGQIKDVCLIIAGKADDPHHLKYIKNLIKEKNFNNVFIFDFLPFKDMRYLMALSNCIVLPYTKNTNSGILMDAVSVNTPVIGSNIGSIKELINEFGIGMLFKSGDVNDLKDKIKLLISNKKLIKEYKNNQRKLQKKFSWKNISKMHLEIYGKKT